MANTVTGQERDILVFCEQWRGELLPCATQLLGEAARLAAKLGEKVAGVALGYGIGALGGELGRWGADRALLCDHPGLEHYRVDAYTAVLAEVVRRERPRILLVGATNLGRDLAPRLAARLDTGLTADCTGLDIQPETGLLLQTRPAFGGNLMATILCARERPQMATVRPGVMEAVEQPEKRAEIVRVPVTLPEEDLFTTLLDCRARSREDLSLDDARVIVSGGRGVQGPEGVALLHRLAGAVGGQVGASRAAVEAGILEQPRQVGQTGRTVRPRLYIACGISGAVQHLAGIQGAETVMAINRDPEAPILRNADYGLCGDLFQVIPRLIELLQRG